MSAHFTAVLEVTKTERPDSGAAVGFQDRRSSAPAPTPPERAVQEVARIVIRADTLEALQAKLSGHVALVTAE